MIFPDENFQTAIGICRIWHLVMIFKRKNTNGPHIISRSPPKLSLLKQLRLYNKSVFWDDVTCRDFKNQTCYRVPALHKADMSIALRGSLDVTHNTPPHVWPKKIDRSFVTSPSAAMQPDPFTSVSPNELETLSWGLDACARRKTAGPLKNNIRKCTATTVATDFWVDTDYYSGVRRRKTFWINIPFRVAKKVWLAIQNWSKRRDKTQLFFLRLLQKSHTPSNSL